MKKLFSCAAIICAVALVGCSKGNKSDSTADGNTTVQDANATVQLPAGLIVEGEQLVDSAGNVIATVVDGAYVDAKGNVIGTVEAIEAQYQNTKNKVESFASQAVDSVKNVAGNVKEGVENKAKEVVSNAKEAGAKAIDDAKKSVSDKLDKGAEALKNEAAKLSK